MPTYVKLAFLSILSYVLIYSTIIPITNDSYSYANMVIQPQDYPPLFPSIVRFFLFPFQLTQETALIGSFIFGSILALVLIPDLLFLLFFEMTKSTKTAFYGLFVYLFGTGITNSYYFANIWSQALAMCLFLGMLIFLFRNQSFKALICMVLIVFAHRLFVYYALAIFMIYLIGMSFFRNKAPFYCLSSTGAITSSLSCIFSYFIVTFPAIWLVALRNTINTLKGEFYLLISFLPLFFYWIDLRVFLVSSSLWCLYVGKEMERGRGRAAIIVIFCILFSVFSYLYTQKLVSVGVF